MSLDVLVRPLAEEDLASAQGWYERQRPGLGAEFQMAVGRCISQVRQNPQIFPIVRKTVRRARIGKFAYWLLFVPLDKRIEILACFHVRRDPQETLRRIS